MKRLWKSGIALVLACALIFTQFNAPNVWAQAEQSDANEQITVYVTVVGDSVHGTEAHKRFENWLVNYKVTLDQGSKAEDAFKKALESNGYSYEKNSWDGINSITKPDGTVLGSGSNGDVCSWMYVIDGTDPNVFMNQYTLKAGEKITAYFIDDWNVWPYTVPTVGINGEGTKANPYTIKDASEIPEVIEEGDVYALSDDITLESGQYIKDIKGTLDGKGHTITLTDTYLADKVEGTIQNLGVTSTSEITLPDNSGSMANTISGKILNSYSTANIAPTGDWEEVGGLVGTMSGSTISNSYFAGKLGGMSMGGIAYTSSSSESKITNSYFTAGYSAASMEYGSNASQKVNCSKKTENDLKSTAGIEALNKDIEDTGFEWSLPTDNSNNGLPVLTAVSNVVDKSQLVSQIEAAEKITNDNYTDKSWNDFQTALAGAIEVNANENATKAQVTAATNNLASAISGLKGKKQTKPVALPTDDSKINHIKTVDQLNFISSSTGKYYVLDNDITITEDDYYLGMENFNGVLDGKGHSIKINNISSSIFTGVDEDGVIQNVYFTGTMNVGQGYKGPLGSNMSGAIINCYTDIKGNGTCGFARRLTNSGVVSNSYSVSEGKGGALFNQYGTNDVKGEGQLINTYWLKTLDNSAIPETALNNSYSETKDYMKSLDFVNTLNANKGDNGVSWGRDGSTGYPYFGESKEYNPEGNLPANKYTVKFNKYDGTTVTVENQKLDISCNDVNGSNIAGTLSLEGVPDTSRIEWSYENVEPAGAIRVGSDQGAIRIDKAGTAVVKATEIKSDESSEVVAAFNLNAYNKDVEEIKLYIDGQDVTNKNFTVQGSELKTVNMEVKYKNENKFVAISPRRFALSVEDEKIIDNLPGSNSFSFKKAGTSTITATYNNNTKLTANVTITSEYVAVKSVTPAINSQVTIHGRNANSDGAKAFNPDYSSVIVEPANATNAANYTVESSDKTIAEYVPSMVIGYVPYKAGTVTYTASIKDVNSEGIENVVSGSKEVTYKYLNPLTSVTTNEKNISVKINSEQAANLTFTGEKSEEGYSVTEPELNWTYSTDGIAKIERKTAYQWKRDESAPDNNNWLPGTDYYVYGLSEGTVTATGTPVDKTNNVEPIVLTITVEPSDEEVPDLTALTNKGIEGFLKYAADKGIDRSFDINGAWNLYTLARAGKNLTINQANEYYNAVVKASKDWTSAATKPTDMEKAALVLSVINRDITNVDGVNIAELIYNSDKLTDGANELIYALLALDARDTKISDDAKWSRDEIINQLKEFQNDDGSFGWAKGTSDVDTTAMALQALGRYQKNATALEMIEKALEYIESKADAEYDYGNANTTAMVVLAITSLNKDVTTTVGTKYKNTITALMKYYNEEDGSFAYLKGGKANNMATIQAVWALTSYKLYTEGEGGYWNLNNIKISYEGEDEYYALEVYDKIAAIGTVTEDSEEAIKEARAAYDSLTSAQKKYVTNYDVLENAELQLDIINGTAITANFSLVGDDVHGSESHVSFSNWMANIKVTVKSGSTAADVIVKAFDDYGYSIIGSTSYISGVTTPEGVSLSAFSNGSRSGWMYAVNGKVPNVGVNRYKLKTDDKIVLYYVDNYGKDKIPTIEDSDEYEQTAAKVSDKIAAIGTVTEDSEEAIKEARAAYDKLTAKQKDLVTNYKALEDAEKQLDNVMGNLISVNFTLIGDDVHGTEKHTSYSTWIDNITVKVKKDSTAADVISKALKNNGYVAEGITTNYISSIKTPAGVSLGEFDNGPKSGWMYSVNDKAPNVGIADYKINANDSLKLYYVDDYTKSTTPTTDVTPDKKDDKTENITDNKVVPGTPNIKVVKTTFRKIKLTWNKSANANKYEIYRKTGKKGTYKKIATTSSLKYTDNKVKTGKKYYYKVVATNNNGSSKYSKAVKTTPKFKTVKLSTKKRAGRTLISWKKVKGATGYKVYRSTKKNGKYKKVKNISHNSKTSYKAKKGSKKYYYKVVAYKK